MRQYIKFYDEDWYEDYPFPTILLVLSDQKKLKHLKRFTEKQECDEEEIKFKFTTMERLLNEDLSVQIWEGVSESQV